MKNQQIGESKKYKNNYRKSKKRKIERILWILCNEILDIPFLWTFIRFMDKTGFLDEFSGHEKSANREVHFNDSVTQRLIN